MALLLNLIHGKAKLQSGNKRKNNVLQVQNQIQYGKLPVSLMWSRVLCKPYLSTAWLPALKPFPYTTDVSDAIWCLKNTLSFFSNGDLAPCLDEVKAEEEDEVDALLASDMYRIWDSNHILARTWQIPSSTSCLRVR